MKDTSGQTLGAVLFLTAMGLFFALWFYLWFS
jgi:hypothetical protein